MSRFNMLPIVVAAARRAQESYAKRVGIDIPLVYRSSITKEQSNEWYEQGKCYLCGDSPGDDIGICNECRYV